MAILSIQSHVAYGYVGNKAAVFPLQSLGYDVWPVNTVQFSNHTGYGQWKGEIFSSKHVYDVLLGIEELGKVSECEAILSGYLGSPEIGQTILNTVAKYKSQNKNVVYLCDPVIGDIGRGVFVKPEVCEFFKNHLQADIITPNHFEAEILTAKKITTILDAKAAAKVFHDNGIKIVVITSLQLTHHASDKLLIFLSDQEKHWLIETPYYPFTIAPNGTGDLFSALFLGNYLKYRDSVLALTRTATLMDEVMRNTFHQQSRELKVISVNYQMVKSNEKIKLLKI